MNGVGTLIVTYNGAPWIRRNLDSLRASESATHVIVVDNASTDNTASIVERDYPEVELIRMPSNAGFGIGNNVGISRALALGIEYILLLNQDAHVSPTAIAEMTDFLRAHDEFGVASPLHHGPVAGTLDRKTLNAYLQRHAQQFLSDACLGEVCSHYAIHGLNAAAWFVRSSVFRRVGGFDPLFFMYGEDDDFLKRLQWHKVRFALLPRSFIVHRRAYHPGRAKKGLWQHVSAIASRARSTLLVEIKDPSFSRSHMAMHLLSKGIVEPFALFLIERKVDEWLGYALAAVRLFARLGQVRRHAVLCSMPGAHFLNPPDVDTPADQPAPMAAVLTPHSLNRS